MFFGFKIAVNFSRELIPGTKQTKYPKVLEKGWIQPGKTRMSTTNDVTIKIHGGSTAPSTAPNGAVPHLSFITEANISSTANNDTATKPMSMANPLIPKTAFKIKTMKATQK